MFGRRRRGSSNPPLDRSAINPNATTAAASAFLASQSSTASLASAAAGAALRSRPTTPTSVADVQTKRTLRRQNSTSSVGSSVAGISHPTLERKSSSGSMSERTFRDQSPGRTSIREASVDAPPVPSIPDNLKPAIPPKSHRRSNSLETAPARLASPPPNRTNGRGSSMGPLGARASPGRGGLRPPSLSSVQELTGVERPASRGSVNFSYPINSPRAMSPTGSMRLTSSSPSRNRRPFAMQPAQITQNGANLVYDPNTRSFRPITEVFMYDDAIQEEERPVGKKKTIQPKGTASGSQIPNGAVFGGPKGTAVNAMKAATSRKQEPQPLVQSQTIVPDPAVQSHMNAFTAPPARSPAALGRLSSANQTPTEMSSATAIEPKKKKKKKVVMPSESGSEQGYTSNMSSDNESDASDYAQQARPRPKLHKRPSIVRELPEDEESDFQSTTSSQRGFSGTDRGMSPTPLPRSNGGTRAKGRVKALASERYAHEKQHTRSASEPPILTEGSTLPAELNGSAGSAIGRGQGSVRGTRTVSVSPARTTRFAAEPGKPTNLAVIHQPPPRSISPRKSALKNSNSPRGPSPADDMSGSWNGTGQTASDLSDNSTNRAPRKKKANRVSFDESNTMVGTAAPSIPSEASILPSPQTRDKRSWFGLKNRGNKSSNGGEDEEDEFMKPRPALPSFGSVRERKIRSPAEERPLVIPSDSNQNSEAEPPSAPLFTSQNVVPSAGTSNDQLVGSVLAQDAMSKHTANTSKLLEPLPPDVTSVEGTGYSSDSSMYDSAREREINATDSEVQSTAAAGTKTEINPNSGTNSDHLVFENAENRDTTAEVSGLIVPTIAVVGSTPTLEETEKKTEWIVPGGFPSGNSDSETPDSETASDTDTIVPSVEPTPASVGIAEPPAESIHLASNGMPVGTSSNDAIIEDTDESGSVYDDAAEELSDGDGFLSLNAVAASPIQALFPIDQTPGLAISTPPDSPTDRNIKERVFRKAEAQKGNDEPEMGEGWDKAQQYWAGLTADKKREMEREARDEAETSEEEEEHEVLPQPKAKKKLVVEPDPVVLPPKRQTSNRTYQIPPGSKASHDGQLTLRSSMRAPPPQNNVRDTTAHMRKSMRNSRSNLGSMRESSESIPVAQPRGALQKKNRPVSAPAPAFQPDPVAVQNHIRQMSTTPVMGTQVTRKQRPAPQLRRTNSNDSDSSFKRARPMSHSMRGSMRNPATQDRPGRNVRSYSPDGEKPRSSMFKIRSLSPTGSAFRLPFNSTPPTTSGQGTMKGTMRNPKDSARSSSLMGFGKSSPKTQAKPKATASRSRSRFAESSDEEDARPAFRSRFVDSSDEEDEPLPLPGRTMRSSTLRSTVSTASASKKIPTIADDGESSDLPDSDDESPAPTSKQSPPPTLTNSTSLRRSGSGRQNISSPTARAPQKQQRTSFFGILRRKKDPESKVRKSDVESAARRDTPLERSRSELLGVRQNSNSNVLQKRNGPPGRQNSGGVASTSSAWPLKNVPQSSGERPATADAAALASQDKSDKRPSMKERRNTATGLKDVDVVGRSNTSDSIMTSGTPSGKNSNVVLGRNGKPKRFMGLRSFLRIKD